MWQKRLASLCKSINYDDLIRKHALSYVMAAMRCYWYKLNEPTAFYASALNRYGVENNDNKNLDFMSIFNSIKTKEDLYRIHKHYEHSSDNPTKHKNNKRLASILFEAKLKGMELVPATFASAAAKFSPDKHNPNKILCPLTSIKGVGASGAELVVKAYEKFGEPVLTMSREELDVLKVEKDGKEVKAFGKKVLDAFFGVVSEQGK